MHLDPDLQWFLLVVILMLVLGLPRITRTISLPVQLQFVELPAQNLLAAQAEYFRQFDEKLNEIGYHAFTTFRVTNLAGANLNRVYTSTSDAARIMVTLLTSMQRTSAQNYVEVITRFQDGTILSSKNSSVSSVFADMPKKISQVFPGIQDVLELKRQHDARAVQLVDRQPLYRGPQTFLSDFQEYHQRFCEYQQSKSLLKLDRAAGVYRVTAWTGLRGIVNFLNPFADNFTLLRLVLGLFAGALPVLLVLIKPAPLLYFIQSRLRIDAAMATLLLLAIANTGAGMALGFLFGRKSFIWAFLLGYLPARFIHLPVPYRVFWGLWMAFVAHTVARWLIARKRLA